MYRLDLSFPKRWR